MPSAKKIIKTYVTDEEYSHIKALSSRLHISQSSLLRKVILGVRLPDPDHPEKIIALMKVNGDMARLGNLFKLIIDEADDENADYTAFEKKALKVFADIEATRKEIKIKAQEL